MKYLGITEEVTTCGCCGRRGLKRTVALDFEDGTGHTYYGTACAARALNTTPANVERRALEAQAAQDTQNARLLGYVIAVTFRNPDDMNAGTFGQLRRDYQRNHGPLGARRLEAAIVAVITGSMPTVSDALKATA